MVSTTTPKFGIRFPTRKERTVKRVTKCETREIQKRLEPPKPPRVRPPPKPKAPKAPTAPKKPPPPATLIKPPKPPRVSASRAIERHASSTSQTSSTASTPSRSMKSMTSSLTGSRVLQATDLEKLARLNCSREFSLFHKFIKPELSGSYENQLAFLQTKLQHLKNEFVNKQAEHLNFEQIREYYNQAVQENVRRRIQPDEFLTLANKLKDDTKQAIDKWLRKKDIKPQKQVTEFLQRRQARIRERIKETLEETKKMQQQQQLEQDDGADGDDIECAITVTPTPPPPPPSSHPITTATTTITVVEDDEIMIID